MHIHILVIEDNFDLAGTVINYLEAAGVVCDHAHDSQTGLDLVRANCYDVIPLDIMLPCISGRQVCRQLREAGLQTPVLMLTALDALQDKLGGLDAGVDDCLLKPFELPELLVRLQAPDRCRSGQTRRLQADDLVTDLGSRQAGRGSTPLASSPTAWKILGYLVRTSPALVTRKQLGRNVQGDELPENNTPNVHMHHLRSTIDKRFATPLIHTLHSVGSQLERK